MDDTLDAWVKFAAIFMEHTIDVAAEGNTILERIEAREFLFGPHAEAIMELLDYDMDAVRAELLRAWDVPASILTP